MTFLLAAAAVAEAPENPLWNPGMHAYWAVVAAIFGLFLGSFYNVCIYRIPAGLSINNPKRSFCYRCGSMIEWLDNIPVLSYLILRGRCRNCGASFSPRYMIVELLTGGLFLWTFLSFNPTADEPFRIETVWFMVFASLLIIGTFTDLDTWIIPDGITIGGTVAALVAAAVIGVFDAVPLLSLYGPFPVIRLHEEGGDGFLMFLALLNGPVRLGLDPATFQWWEPLANSVIGAVFGPALLYGIAVGGKFIFRKDAMGMGDVKLFALIGASLGITGSLVTLFLACVFGAVAGGIGVLVGRLKSAPSFVLQEGPRSLPPRDEPPPGVTEADRDVRKLAALGQMIPRGKSVHHLPFGPWIALGALVVVLFRNDVHWLMMKWMS